MRTELQQFFLEVAQKEFGFLVTGGKFRGPLAELDAKTGIFTVVFIGKNLAVELILDIRDEDVSCEVARMVGDRPATDYRVDTHGRRVRGSLWALLQKHGVSENQLVFTKAKKGLPLKEKIPLWLNDYARMLQSHGEMVLDDNPAFLDVV